MTKRNSYPSAIGGKAKKFMRELMVVLEDKNINTALDKAAISLIAHTYDNYIKATEILEHDGLTIYQYSGASKNIRAHPAVKIQLDAQIQLTKLLVEFGLTPKSRKDIDSQRSAPEASPLELFIGGEREAR